MNQPKTKDGRSSDTRNDLLAYMIGPRAENLKIFEQLVNEVMQDHLFWRRNFHPEDRAIISAHDQNSSGYREFVDRLRDHLFEFLSEAKRGIPFFSPRYLGHMNTDLLLPALVGYFGAMLYNQNNVAGESSPVTVKYEGEVMKTLSKMVGYDPDHAFGYLCSGGTAANLYSLWVAKNARTLPISLRMALSTVKDMDLKAALKLMREAKIQVSDEKECHRILISAAETLTQKLQLSTARGEKKRLTEFSCHELMNVPIDELAGLRRLAGSCILPSQGRSDKEARAIFDVLVQGKLIKTLGDSGFRRATSECIPELDPVRLAVWQMYAAKNKHYCWGKVSDILGFGHEAIKEIGNGPGFDMNVDQLLSTLRSAGSGGQQSKTWPFFLSSLFGSTEEGALDDLPSIRTGLRELQEEEGTVVWWHADAAYGGYLGSIVRSSIDDDQPVDVGDIDTAGTLKWWLMECCRELGLDTAENEESDRRRISDLIDLSETGTGTWLSWQALVDRVTCLGDVDSIALDPHKLGYIPYPAGAVLLRNGSLRSVVSHDAPYLWKDDRGPADFVGRYTLEGSRPGATAAACWLAHEVVPLDQRGHGKLIALSILGTRELYTALKSRFGNEPRQTLGGARVAVVHQPHMNVLCYMPYHEASLNSAWVKALTKHVKKGLSPTDEVRPFMVVGSNVTVDPTSPALSDFPFDEVTERAFHPDVGPRGVDVLRSVVMGPFALAASARKNIRGEFKPLLATFAESLTSLICEKQEVVERQMMLKKLDTYSRELKIMVMDDNPDVPRQLKVLLAELNHPSIVGFEKTCESENEALHYIRDSKSPLDVVFLDIDMRGSSNVPRGTEEGGYHAYRAVLERNQDMERSFAVQLVVFFTRGFASHEQRLEEIRGEFPNVRVSTETLNKRALVGPQQELGETEGSVAQRRRVEAVRTIVRGLAAIADGDSNAIHDAH